AQSVAENKRSFEYFRQALGETTEIHAFVQQHVVSRVLRHDVDERVFEHGFLCVWLDFEVRCQLSLEQVLVLELLLVSPDLIALHTKESRCHAWLCHGRVTLLVLLQLILFNNRGTLAFDRRWARLVSGFCRSDLLCACKVTCNFRIRPYQMAARHE